MGNSILLASDRLKVLLGILGLAHNFSQGADWHWDSETTAQLTKIMDIPAVYLWLTRGKALENNPFCWMLCTVDLVLK